SINLPFARMTAKAADWGVPMLLGEYGATPTAGNVRAYVDELYRQLDKALASGTQWVYTPGWDPALKDGWNGEDFSIVDDTGATRANFRVRPFPRAVAGEPTAIRVTYQGFLKANSIEVEWMHDPALGETEIFAPKDALFPDGMTFTQTEGDDLACAYDAEERFIHCTSSVAGPKRFKIRGCVELFGLCL
ncbi:MAG: hypothetical protein KC466_00410, partial [Myxococcales bacterium]|nr:hypothetical protein [Myxococcales bacterium]